MFERFTNRARHVVVLSQEEARMLDHNYIGTEHILLGVLGEPDSVGGSVLASFGFTRDDIREEVARRVGRGKAAPSGHIPFTPRAKKTLELSLREALAIGHKYIGTEHILLGLIREGEGIAAQVMRDRADLAEIRAAVIEAVPKAGDPEGDEGTEETNAVLRWLRNRLSRHGASAPFRPGLPGDEQGTAGRGTPAVEAALQQAARLAGPLPVGSHHLLLAALEDRNSAASAALGSLGVDLDELQARLRDAQLAGTSDEAPEQAGRRQMAIQVSPEMLHLVFTDPVMVAAGNEALHAVRVGEAAAGTREATPGEAEGEQPSPAGEAAAARAAAAAATGAATGGGVIRGDHPAAAGLTTVWRATLAALATLTEATDPTPPAKRTATAVPLQLDDDPDDGEAGGPEGPAAASS
jgi:ATP-dependent Clp protease ATP-binding subunit ClpA